jgi:hypothetical protein
VLVRLHEEIIGVPLTVPHCSAVTSVIVHAVAANIKVRHVAGADIPAKINPRLVSVN